MQYYIITSDRLLSITSSAKHFLISGQWLSIVNSESLQTVWHGSWLWRVVNDSWRLSRGANCCESVFTTVEVGVLRGLCILVYPRNWTESCLFLTVILMSKGGSPNRGPPSPMERVRESIPKDDKRYEAHLLMSGIFAFASEPGRQ